MELALNLTLWLLIAAALSWLSEQWPDRLPRWADRVFQLRRKGE